MLLLAAVSAVVSGCATPGQRLDGAASAMGFDRAVARGPRFPEVVYSHYPATGGAVLHVYLSGDGTPWAGRYRVARDPTPRNPVMLRLMALDPAPAVYLSRPCYDGFAGSAPCTSRLWTVARYSRQLVDNMAAVLRGLLAAGRYDGVVLMGYSGGGALAMLLAERLPKTRAVITIAGNLDPEAWTAYHRYSPLSDSLNPARRPPLARSILQLHIAGAADDNIPPQLVSAAVRRQGAHFVVLQGIDHRCCWERVWPAVLRGLAEGAPWRYVEGAATAD